MYLYRVSVAPVRPVTDTHTERHTQYFRVDYVRVLFAGDPPTIVRQPLESEFTVLAGNTVDIAVSANGVSLMYQWQRNEIDLVENPPKISGSNTSQLTVASLEESDAGSYRCVVSNGNTPASDAIFGPIQLIVGKYTSCSVMRLSIFLLCIPTVYPVAITMDPVSLSDVIPGSQVMFSVTASADPAGGTLNYQWRQNGMDIMDDAKFSGATTDTLTISDVQESDQGSYYCNVSNNNDDTSSSTVTLDVRKF